MSISTVFCIRENSPPEIIQARALQDTEEVPSYYYFPLIPPPELEGDAAEEELPPDAVGLL